MTKRVLLAIAVGFGFTGFAAVSALLIKGMVLFSISLLGDSLGEPLAALFGVSFPLAVSLSAAFYWVAGD